MVILALNKHDALYIFTSIKEAERYWEAVDVQQDAIEFCDESGQRYSPIYTVFPKESRFGPLRMIEIGMFRLQAESVAIAELPGVLLQRAAYLEHSSVPALNSLESARQLLRNEGHR